MSKTMHSRKRAHLKNWTRKTPRHGHLDRIEASMGTALRAVHGQDARANASKCQNGQIGNLLIYNKIQLYNL
jgi:hypothetical protein